MSLWDTSNGYHNCFNDHNGNGYIVGDDFINTIIKKIDENADANAPAVFASVADGDEDISTTSATTTTTSQRERGW